MTDHNSPLIQKASGIYLRDDIKEKQNTYSYGKMYIFESAIPLSVFFIFDMLNTCNQTDIQNIWQAKKVLLYGNDSGYGNSEGNHFEPSRILTVSIGGVSNNHNDLRSLSDLFSKEYLDD